MQILAPNSNAAPFSTDKHITTAAKLSASESKLLTSTKAEIDRMNGLAERCAKPRMGMSHPLDAEIHAASAALAENPTTDAAEKLHALITRKHTTELSASAVSDAIRRAVSREIEKLAPLALRIVDDAEKTFLAEAEAHREATKNQTTFASAAADFSARLEATKQALEAKRKWIRDENAAAHFLLLELGLGAS